MSDDTTATIIEKITVRYSKTTVIPSGHSVTVFYDCAKLSPGDLARLAAQAVGDLDLHHFDCAVGIAYTGIFFAAAVAGGRHAAILQADGNFAGPDIRGMRVVVVDDVVHSGRRLREAAKRVVAAGATVVGYACIIDRSEGKAVMPQSPLWSAYQTGMC